MSRKKKKDLSQKLPILTISAKGLETFLPSRTAFKAIVMTNSTNLAGDLLPLHIIKINRFSAFWLNRKTEFSKN